MKDKSFFANPGDLRQKLNGTICRYKGEPYYIENNGEQDVIWLQSITEKKHDPFLISPDDRDFDYSSPPLGFANHKDRCTFVGRLPARRSVQGINESNLLHYDLEGKEVGPIKGFFLSQGMYDCIMGKFEPFETVLRRFLRKDPDKAYSQAFARHFALCKRETPEILLYHRLQQIGHYDRTESRFSLIPTYNNPVILSLLKGFGVPVNES